MIELLTGLLIGSTVALVAVGYVAHRREERRPPTPPPPPPRVQVWMDDRLVYDGPERRTSPRVPLREERGYRWPDLKEEATTEPIIDRVTEARGGMTEGEIEHARRWAGQFPVIEGGMMEVESE